MAHVIRSVHHARRLTYQIHVVADPTCAVFRVEDISYRLFRQILQACRASQRSQLSPRNANARSTKHDFRVQAMGQASARNDASNKSAPRPRPRRERRKHRSYRERRRCYTGLGCRRTSSRRRRSIESSSRRRFSADTKLRRVRKEEEVEFVEGRQMRQTGLVWPDWLALLKLHQQHR